MDIAGSCSEAAWVTVLGQKEKGWLAGAVSLAVLARTGSPTCPGVPLALDAMALFHPIAHRVCVVCGVCHLAGWMA